MNYLNDDGTIVEPEYYVPIIPFALMNGISGIGTGFSCSIPSYQPTQIIEYLQNKLKGGNVKESVFIPYYEGFKGTITKMADQKYMVKGKYEKIGDDKIRITELPVGTWTMPYTSFLEGLMDGVVDKNGKRSASQIRDFTSISTEVNVDFTITFPRGKLSELESTEDANGINGVEKLLKLTTTISTTNMHMFNSECKLHKYESVEEIIDDFYKVRIQLYQKRKAYLVEDMERKLVKLSNRAKYIQETLAGTIDLRRKKADVVTKLLQDKQYAMIDGDYKYLIKMPMDSVTEENVEQIMKEKADTEHALDVLKKTSVEKMWLKELGNLNSEYAKYKTKREKLQLGEQKNVKAATKTTKTVKSGAKKQLVNAKKK